MALTPEEHSALWLAQDMYCVQRLPLKQIALMLGESLENLQKWCKRYHWSKMRAEMARVQADGSMNFEIALNDLKAALRENQNPQTAFAVASLENVKLKMEVARRKYGTDFCAPESSASLSEAQRVNLLEEAINRRISHLVHSSQELSASSVKDILSMLQSLRSMKNDMVAEGTESKASVVRWECEE